MEMMLGWSLVVLIIGCVVAEIAGDRPQSHGDGDLFKVIDRI
jgi:hypothetical protein